MIPANGTANVRHFSESARIIRIFCIFARNFKVVYLSRLRIIGWFLAAFVVVSCAKAQEELPVHELTPEEQEKQHLDQSFANFVALLDLDKISSDPRDYILRHSDVSLGRDGSVIYRFTEKGITLITLQFRRGNGLWKVEGRLYGGLGIQGVIDPVLTPDWEKWEEKSLIYVYDNGVRVARLGLETYEGAPLPVLRFPDGTSYSLTSLLIVEPLVEFLLEYVLSTE